MLSGIFSPFWWVMYFVLSIYLHNFSYYFLYCLKLCLVIYPSWLVYSSITLHPDLFHSRVISFCLSESSKCSDIVTWNFYYIFYVCFSPGKFTVMLFMRLLTLTDTSTVLFYPQIMFPIDLDSFSVILLRVFLFDNLSDITFFKIVRNCNPIFTN